MKNAYTLLRRQTLNAVTGNNCCLFWESHGMLMYCVGKMPRF